jgi:predicted PurR-regulated permease PerM
VRQLVTDRGEGTHDSASEKRIRDAALLLLTVAGLYLCWILARPFLAAMAWAIAFAVLVLPLHRRFERVLALTPAAVISTLAVGLLILLPGTLLLREIVDEVRTVVVYELWWLWPARI